MVNSVLVIITALTTGSALLIAREDQADASVVRGMSENTASLTMMS